MKNKNNKLIVTVNNKDGLYDFQLYAVDYKGRWLHETNQGLSLVNFLIALGMYTEIDQPLVVLDKIIDEYNDKFDIEIKMTYNKKATQVHLDLSNYFKPYTLHIILLKEMLEKAKIPFKFESYPFQGAYRIIILNNNNVEICKAISFPSKEKCIDKKGLITMYGALTKKEEILADHIGYLTAEESFERIKYCYEHNTKTYKRGE